MPVLPGSIRQNGYVVHDLDATAHWFASEMNIGPWVCLRELELDGFVHRGRPSSPTISIALANSGDLQLELIVPHDDQPSMYREFLDAGREGLQHHAWWTDDYDGVVSAAADAGWTVGHEGDMGGTRFLYFDQGPLAAELMEINDLNQWMFGQVREAADTWDGSADPVREFG
jgi:hypothetical protein